MEWAEAVRSEMDVNYVIILRLNKKINKLKRRYNSQNSMVLKKIKDSWTKISKHLKDF